MSIVEDYIYGLDGEQQTICMLLHDYILTYPNLSDKIRYKIPFYYGKSWICYLNPQKKGGVELVFLRGNELSNDHVLLDAKGRKQVKGITYSNSKNIDLEALDLILSEALILDQSVKYSVRKK